MSKVKTNSKQALILFFKFYFYLMVFHFRDVPKIFSFPIKNGLLCQPVYAFKLILAKPIQKLLAIVSVCLV